MTATAAPASIARAERPLPMRWLAFVAASLIAGDAIVRLTYWGRSRRDTALLWFDSTVEGTLPTCFTVALTLAIGLVCLRRGDGNRTWWRITGALFTYLACDDVFMLHERFGALAHPHLSGTGIYACVLTIGPLFVLLGTACAVFLLRALRNLPGHRRLLWFGFASLGTALVLEALAGGAERSAMRLRGIPLLCYTQWLEEALEILGPLLLLGAVWPTPPPPADPEQVRFIGAGR